MRSASKVLLVSVCVAARVTAVPAIFAGEMAAVGETCRSATLPSPSNSAVIPPVATCSVPAALTANPLPASDTWTFPGCTAPSASMGAVIPPAITPAAFSA